VHQEQSQHTLSTEVVGSASRFSWAWIFFLVIVGFFALGVWYFINNGLSWEQVGKGNFHGPRVISLADTDPFDLHAVEKLTNSTNSLLQSAKQDKNLKYALAFTIKAAKAGDAAAQMRLGEYYWLSTKAEDIAEAVIWFGKAAEQNDAAAEVRMGEAFRKGRGVPKSEKDAFYWYTKAADKGNAEGIYQVGVAYSDGRGVSQDHGKALAFFQKGAAQGYADSIASLGLMYDKGRGTPKDFDKAFALYSEAAAKGLPRGLPT